MLLNDDKLWRLALDIGLILAVWGGFTWMHTKKFSLPFGKEMLKAWPFVLVTTILVALSHFIPHKEQPVKHGTEHPAVLGFERQYGPFGPNQGPSCDQTQACLNCHKDK